MLLTNRSARASPGMLCRPRSPSLPLLGVAARSSGPARQLALALRAAKGFGKTKPPARKAGSDAADDDEEGGPSKSRRQARRTKQLQQTAIGPIPGQAQRQPLATSGPPQSQFGALADPAAPPVAEDTDFMSRLTALKEQTKQRQADSAAAAPAIITATPAIFDAPAAPPAPAGAGAGSSVYDNPPPLSQTVTAAMAAASKQSEADYTGISDPQLRNAEIGPSQLGLAAGAIVFIAIFVVVAAGDYAPASKRYEGVTPAVSAPDPIEEKIIKGKVARYEDALKVNPFDDEATSQLANAYVRLLQYDKAIPLYEKLANRNRDNADAWRLLGESALLGQQPRRAVPAFERAVALRDGGRPDQQLLTGLVDAYVANADFARAVEALRGVREALRAYNTDMQERQVAEAAAEAVGAASEEAAAASIAAEVAAAPLLTAPPLTDGAEEEAAGSAAAGSAAAPAAAAPAAAAPAPAAAAWRLDPVGVELLTGKVFSAWRGHEQDALATYDGLIKAFPEDYRGYLAKGLFLKEQGRKADAERMFLQARFFAPSSMQQVVRAIAESSPVRDLPSN